MIQRLRPASGGWLSAVGWMAVGLPVVALLLRFVMRTLVVRTDLPFPGFIYAITAPIVEPFYRLFPASPRYDGRVVEVASLAAAGVVFVLATALYVGFLLLMSLLNKDGRRP